MDYNKMLFAFHVRERAMARAQQQLPDNLDAVSRDAYLQRILPMIIEEVVREIKGVSDMISRAE